LGDHLRKRRLDLGLFQREVASMLGVSLFTILQWESNKTAPGVHYIPKITDFLGYCPYTPARSFGEKLAAWRRYSLGLSQREMAKRLGVDASTLARWEKDEKRPSRKFLDIIRRGWVSSHLR